MRLIDAERLYFIPAEDDNCTGMGMSYKEQEVYNEAIDDCTQRVKAQPTAYDIEEVINRLEELKTRRWTADAAINAYDLAIEIVKGELK